MKLLHCTLLNFAGNYHCPEDGDRNASLQSAGKTEATEEKRTDQDKSKR